MVSDQKWYACCNKKAASHLTNRLIFYGGEGEIRTHGAVTLGGFQDTIRTYRPLISSGYGR